MAERIDNLTFLPGRPAKYPWAEWADGSGWRLTRGVDFASEMTSSAMRGVITSYAARQGVKVQTSVPDADTVEFQFAEPTGAAA